MVAKTIKNRDYNVIMDFTVDFNEGEVISFQYHTLLFCDTTLERNFIKYVSEAFFSSSHEDHVLKSIHNHVDINDNASCVRFVIEGKFDYEDMVSGSNHFEEYHFTYKVVFKHEYS